MSDEDRSNKELHSIQNFGDDGSEDIFFGEKTRKARNLLDTNDFSKAQEIMDKLNDGTAPMDLKLYDPEPLPDWGKGWHSMSINKQDRVVCIWDSMNNNAYNVEITDYHD